MKILNSQPIFVVLFTFCALLFSCGESDEPIPVANLTMDDLVGAWYEAEEEVYIVLNSDLSGKSVSLVDGKFAAEDELIWRLSNGALTIKRGSTSQVYSISRCSSKSLMLIDKYDEVLNFEKVKLSSVPTNDNTENGGQSTDGYQTNGEEGYTRPAAVVDMGFTADDGSKLYWSTCNLGAQSPLARGDFFKWGYTTVKNPGTFGEEISGTEYDFARVKLGGKWRMPTWTEFKKLLDSDNCRNVVSIEDGRWFVKFISEINGNVLFFPLPGYSVDGKHLGDNEYGRYLSGTTGTSSRYSKMVWMSKFGPSGENQVAQGYGYSVRPVYSGD